MDTRDEHHQAEEEVRNKDPDETILLHCRPFVTISVKATTGTEATAHRELHQPVIVTSPLNHVCLLNAQEQDELNDLIAKAYIAGECECSVLMCACRLASLAEFARRYSLTSNSIQQKTDVYAGPCCAHCYKIAYVATGIMRNPTTREIMTELASLRQDVIALRGRVAELESSHEDVEKVLGERLNKVEHSVMMERASKTVAEMLK